MAPRLENDNHTQAVTKRYFRGRSHFGYRNLGKLRSLKGSMHAFCVRRVTFFWRGILIWSDRTDHRLRDGGIGESPTCQ